jgi:catalase
LPPLLSKLRKCISNETFNHKVPSQNSSQRTIIFQLKIYLSITIMKKLFQSQSILIIMSTTLMTNVEAQQQKELSSQSQVMFSRPDSLPGQASSPAQLVDALHSAFGTHHARAVHAKGIILEGNFIPASSAASLTKAWHMQQKESMVIVRFSNFTGIPDIPDNIGAANPRGMAIKFKSADGKTTDIVGHSFDGFPTPTSDQFRELLLAIGASGPQAVKPTDLDKFLSTHPVARTFLTTQKTPGSYADINYFGVNTFKFTSKEGITKFIRYQFIPADGEVILTEEAVLQMGNDFLIKEMGERVAKKPFKFLMYAQIAEASDNIEDPSIPFPESRKKVFLGTILIKNLAANTDNSDKELSFSPNNLPDGIEAADPMLIFRSKAYPISVKERQ